jgi:UDP-glucuronate 4-epimerase
MHILVTGGAGFIGSHLVDSLLAQGAAVDVLDDFNDYYSPRIKRENLAAARGRIVVHEVDLRDAIAVGRVVEGGGYDVIVHLAARAGVRPSIKDPRLYVDTNISGTLNLLESARRSGVGRFVFASSSSVYGLCPNAPFREDEPLTQTISPYAATKLAGEHLCANYAHLYGMRTVCLRFFTVYGPRQRPDLAIHQFTRRIWQGQPIDQFGDGGTRRDYTYVDDIVQGVLAALEYQGPIFDIFNLGESRTTALRDLIIQIETALGRDAVIRQLPEQPGDVPMTCADITKARTLLGYAPGTSVEEGIPRFVEWFLQMQAGERTPRAAKAAPVYSPVAG